MRFTIISLAGICALMLAGCQHSKIDAAIPAPPPKPAETGKPTMTTLDRIVGHVIKLNAALKYVVIEFPTGRLPVPNQRLGVYRARQKVGEIVISPQPRENTFAADIVAGDVQVGDEARDD